MPGEFQEIVVYLRGGLNNATDPSSIDDDQLTTATGIEYRPPRRGLFALPGRSQVDQGLTATASTGGIFGLKYFEIDDNTGITAADRYLVTWARGAGATALSFVGTADTSGRITWDAMSYLAYVSERWATTSTAVFDMVHYNNDWFAWNGSENNLRIFDNSLDSRQWTYAGLISVTASGSAVASGSGSTLAAGDYELWWTQQDAAESANQSSYSGTVTTVTLSASGEKIVFTLPSIASTPNGLSVANVFATRAGQKFPYGFQQTTGLAYSPGNTTTITAFDETTPYKVASPIGGVGVSADDPPPVAYDMVVYEDSLVAIDASDRQVIKYSLVDTPLSWPSINYIPFETARKDKLNALAVVNDLLLVFSDYYVFRLLTLPRHTDPEDIASARSRIKKKFIEGHGAVSHQGAITINTPATGEICLFVCRDGIHATDGSSMTYAIPGIDWFNMVDPNTLSRCVLIDNPKRSRVQFYYIDKTDTSQFKCLHIYYHELLISDANGRRRYPVLGPHRVPGLTPTIGLLGGEWYEWSGDDSTAHVYLEGTGTTDAALIVDSNGTINKRWQTKDFYPAGANGEIELHRVYTHQSDTTASGSYPLKIRMATDDLHAGVPFTATSTVDQTLKKMQPHEFTDRAQSFSIYAAKDDTGDLQELDYVVFVIKNPTELASAKSS